MTRRQRGIRLVFTTFAAMLIGLPTLAQSIDDPLARGADELVPLIQENMEDIELQLRVDPAGAEENLARQKERLEAVRAEAPDHPVLSSLERRVEELEEEIAAARASAAESPLEEEQFVPVTVPADVRVQLRDVRQLQNQSDREMMRGETESAVAYLNQAEALLAQIEEEYGDQIPPGYAALIVAEERLAALRDQLARQRAD